MCHRSVHATGIRKPKTTFLVLVHDRVHIHVRVPVHNYNWALQKGAVTVSMVTNMVDKMFESL